MVEITVEGEAVRRAAAERARITVQSRWQAEAPEAAMGAVTAAHQSVVDDAKRLVDAGSAESWHADRVWLSHHREWVGEGQPQRTVYTAAAAVTATFVDLDALGRWLASLGGEQVHEVGEIAWTLTEETERTLARGARQDAVADAVERAADYAAAASLGPVRVVAIREPGLAQPGPSPKARGVEMMAMADAGGAPVALRAGEVEVRAAVEVAFATGGDSAGR